MTTAFPTNTTNLPTATENFPTSQYLLFKFTQNIDHEEQLSSLVGNYGETNTVTISKNSKVNVNTNTESTTLYPCHPLYDISRPIEYKKQSTKEKKCTTKKENENWQIMHKYEIGFPKLNWF